MGEGHQTIRGEGGLSLFSEPIGFIGLGAMGAPMARHLATRGYPLLVNDVNPRAVQSVVDCGARGGAAHPQPAIAGHFSFGRNDPAA
jgi:hypothetical protein